MREAVEYVLETEDADGQVLNCRTCDLAERYCHSCPVTAGLVPTITPQVGFWLDVYNRAKAFNALPNAGGLFDQEERVMVVLDTIDGVVTEHAKRKRQKAKEPPPQTGGRAWR